MDSPADLDTVCYICLDGEDVAPFLIVCKCSLKAHEEVSIAWGP